MSILYFLNEVCKSNQYTISAIGSIATALAIIVSLFLFYFQNRTKLKAVVNTFSGYGVFESQEYIAVTISNFGLNQIVVGNYFIHPSVPSNVWEFFERFIFLRKFFPCAGLSL